MLLDGAYCDVLQLAHWQETKPCQFSSVQLLCSVHVFNYQQRLVFYLDYREQNGKHCIYMHRFL